MSQILTILNNFFLLLEVLWNLKTKGELEGIFLFCLLEHHYLRVHVRIL